MRRKHSNNRGVVLIVVVALLMLLAIAATAFLASSRGDRVTTRQASINTQAELLLDGVVNVAGAKIAASATQPATAAGSDDWLASRVAATLDPNSAYGGPTSASPNPACWPAVSAPLLGSAAFESPNGQSYTARDHLLPTFSGPAGSALSPALRTNSGSPALAVDADGDGIADAGLFRLPGASIDGVTYYGAIRVIDHSAAINLNTAVSRDYDFRGDGTTLLTSTSPTAGAFIANIGLAELLHVNSFSALNTYRWNLSSTLSQPAGVAGGSDAKVFDDTQLVTGLAGPRVDASGSFTEWQFPTLGAFVQSQIAQRLDHPGPVSADGLTPARSLFPDGLNLGSRFSTPWPGDASSSALLTALDASINIRPSTGLPIASNPYSPGNSDAGVDAWFTTHFDTLSENASDPATWMCRRTLLTDFNGVSAQSPEIPLPFVPAGANGAIGRKKVSITTGPFEDLFYGYFKTMAQPGFTGQGDSAGTPFSPLNAEAVALRSTVGFSAAAGIYTAAGDFYADPYIGTRFNTAAPATPLVSSDRNEPASLASVVNGQTNVAEQHPLRMFRSPLRPPPQSSADGSTPVWDRYTPHLPADQVLILRSALAAANLEALRDSSHNPQFPDPSNLGLGRNERAAAHRIPLTAMIDGQPTSVVATVFGLRRQPFITEIYANTLAGLDGAAAPAPPALIRPNPKGYVAIKIYNPTAVPISLQNCRLVGLHRSRENAYASTGDGYPNMTVQPLSALISSNTASTDQIDLGSAAITSNVLGGIYPPTVIPAHGTLVLENIPGSGPAFAGTAAEDANYRPTSTGLLSANGDNTGLITPADFERQNFAYVPGLTRVVWDRDVVLMRPTNCRPPSTDDSPVNTLVYLPANPDASSNAITGMMPLDSFDFTGLAPMDDPAYNPVRRRAEIWHYVRAASTNGWQWVYPGRYDGDQSLSAAPRQQGTVRAVGIDGAFGWNPRAAQEKDPFAEHPLAGNVVSLATPIAAGTAATYPDVFTLRLNDSNWPSNSLLHDYTQSPATPNLFPFGGFTRLADMLEAPFIGAYTLQTASNAAAGNDVYLDITPVTMDSVFAEDTDPADNEQTADNGSQSREQIGRFIPLRPSVARTGGAPASDVFKTNSDPTLPPTIGPQNDPAFDTASLAAIDPQRYGDAVDDQHLNRYAFAGKLFDQFLTIAPTSNYSPNYPTQPQWSPGTAYAQGDVVQYGQHLFVCKIAHTSGNNAAPSRGAPDWLDPGADTNPPTPPTASINWLPLPRYLIARTDHDTDPLIPGQVNLNTAPEAVLAALPWSPRRTADAGSDSLTFNFSAYPPTVTAGGDGIDDNAQIAHAIVLYRDGRYGHTAGVATNNLGIAASPQTWCAAGTPFRSLFDLYNVPGIRAAQNALLPSNAPIDFADQTLLLNRVSSLVTTRSDVFTLYALVQGWKDAGTDHARLATQRRVSLLMRRELDADGTSHAKIISRIP